MLNLAEKLNVDSEMIRMPNYLGFQGYKLHGLSLIGILKDSYKSDGSYLAKHKEESIKAPVLSFWELAARDIDQNLVNFDQFKGKKAIVIVNVASNSKYTESNYKQLSQMRE